MSQKKEKRSYYNSGWFICPKCGGDILERTGKLACVECQQIYNVVDGIPVFQKDGASDEEKGEKSFWESGYKTDEVGGFHAFAASSFQFIVDNLSLPDHALGLDFACGSGTFEHPMDNRQIVGLDISLPLLQASSGIVPVQGSGLSLPFIPALFDFAICNAALHHMPDPPKAISEIARDRKSTRLNSSHIHLSRMPSSP